MTKREELEALTSAEKARALDAGGHPYFWMTPDGWQLTPSAELELDSTHNVGGRS